jgi:hypothetical protein
LAALKTKLRFPEEEILPQDFLPYGLRSCKPDVNLYTDAPQLSIELHPDNPTRS